MHLAMSNLDLVSMHHTRSFLVFQGSWQVGSCVKSSGGSSRILCDTDKTEILHDLSQDPWNAKILGDHS